MAMNKVNKDAVLKTWGPMVQAITKGMINESALTRDRQEWMAEYAHNHATYQSLNEAEGYNASGLAYNNVFNTMGMGNPMPAERAAGTAGEGSAYGSADKWPALLPVALQVAAKTVGFDLVNTTPFAGPTGVIPFLDYVYAGSKQPGGAAPYAQTGRKNPANFEASLYDMPEAFVATLKVDKGAKRAEVLAAAEEALVAAKLSVENIGKSRVDGNPIFRVNKAETTAKSLLEAFGENGVIEVEGGSLSRPRLVSMLENHILGYAGAGVNDKDKWSATWMDGKTLYNPMDRATGETQYPRQLALEMFTKFVSVGTVQIAISCTQDQVHDLSKQWGMDVMKLLENSGVNEISQTINKHILSRLFALGWKNHLKAEIAEGINLNLNLDAGEGSDVEFAYYEEDETVTVLGAMSVPARHNYGSLTNQDTEFKRVFSNMLAAGNVIAQRGRRGAANFVVTNLKVATILQTNAQYGFAPIANTINQTAGSLYPVGTVGGMTVYVDPNMAYEDTRVLVGRKGGKEEPGLHFCPYLLADKIQTISEATMSPKMWVRSRYALTDVGFFPETQYLTFYVQTPVGTF